MVKKKRVTRLIAVFCIVIGLLFNPFFIGQFLTVDKSIDAPVVITIIIIIESVLILLGIGILLFPKWFIKKRKELLLLAIVLVLCFGILEIGMRISTSCQVKYDFVSDATKYKHEPNKEHCHKTYDDLVFRVQSNNEGFIDDDFVENTTAHTIFLLGDSFAQCLQATQEACVHQNLESKLKKQYDTDINVYNFGVAGYGNFNELGILQQYKDKYTPKLIILYFLAQNDLLDNERYETADHMSFAKKSRWHFLRPKLVHYISEQTHNFM